MKIILRTLFFLLLFSNLQGQKLDHVQGEFIIWHEESNGRSRDALIQSMGSFEGRTTNIRHETIATSLPLSKIQIDFRTVNEYDFLSKLQRTEGIKYAQFNHLLEARKSPNDELFDRQYQWLSMGTMASDDADISATDAWDITTGGTTVDGQEIVVALLELGIQDDHPDLVDNLWLNSNEIPDNGIDDDANGYIDDHRGWNVQEQNDNIKPLDRFDNHGTATFGMIGAKGNNQIGVSGINWDVKVMNVTIDGSLEEASVIEAYDYVLNHRKRYNDTNGAEGAFVVSTNLSYGSLQIKPADAPIWCGFYDALGAEGILNCGATDNDNINIDEIGDMPTSCSSDFLISVSSSDANNKKEEFAAFGKNDIDLMAPGEEVWTTDLDSSYIIESGTSYASPTVAGAIALYWSAASQDKLEAYKSNPAQLALETKQIILSTVDPIAGAEDLFVSGGRLNIFSAITTESVCELPVSDVRTSISTRQVTLLWETIDSAAYIVEFRQLNAANWERSDTLNDGIFSIDVTACQDYAYRVISICPNQVDPVIGPTLYFSSLPALVGINVVNSTDTSLIVEIDSLLGISQIVVTIGNDSTATIERLNNTQFLVGNLLPDSNYVVQVGYTCSRTIDKNLRDEIVIGKTEKAPCESTVYCDVGTTADSIWIESFVLGCIDNVSGDDNGYAYSDFNDCVLDRGLPYIFSVDIMTSSDSLLNFFGIWIDADRNGFFNEEELIYSSDSLFLGGILMDTVYLPFDAMGGDTRLRIITDTSLNGISDGCLASGPGEVEDYCIYVNENCPNIPVALDSLSVTENSIFLVWSDVPMSLAYIYRFRKQGTNEWDTVLHCNDTLMLEELDACSTYDIQIMSICQFDTSTFSESLLIDTECEDGRQIQIQTRQLAEVFPNPFMDYVHIRDAAYLDVRWQLVDMQGRIVGYGNLNSSNGELQGLANLASGVYHLVLEGPNNFREIHRLMKL